MSSTTAPKILLTGATGYIGGTILTTLLNSPSPSLRNTTISLLLRGQDRADKLTSTYGSRVHPILYKDLDDLDATVAAASQHDIIISTTAGYHSPSSQALIRGLAQRKAATGRDAWLLHTSGTSNLADRPVTGARLAGREFDDAADDVYAYEKALEAADMAYPQRTTELAVVDAGLELGVKTLVVMSPTIYGFGSGLFNTLSIQVPMFAGTTVRTGRAVVVGEGTGVWDHVHVEDLAELYLLMLRRVLENGGEGVPTGKKGIIFSGNGRHSWLELSQGVADACFEKGVLPDREVHKVGIPDVLKTMDNPIFNADVIELGFASNSRTVSNVARSLGWKPTKGEEAWKQEFRDVVEAILAKGA